MKKGCTHQFKTFNLALTITLISQLLIGQDSLKRYPHNFAIMAGNGVTFGGTGLLAEDQINLKTRLYLTPFVAFGLMQGDPNTNRVLLGNALGLTIEWGHNHRILGGLCYGTLGLVDQTIFNNGRDRTHFSGTEKKLSYGPSGIIGYKGMTDFGIVWIVYLSSSHTLYNISEGRYTFSPGFGTGIGYRFKSAKAKYNGG
jgi:hypothetical protein